MHHWLCRGFITWLMASSLVTAGLGRAASREERAESIYQHGLTLLARNTIDSRRLALRELEQATLLEPANPNYQLTLGRAYYQAGFLKSARTRFERVVRMAPQEAEGRFGLGQVWRRDWLKYLDRNSLARAIDHFSTAARMNPGACDSWLMLVPLLIEQGDLKAAAAAAARALEAEPRRAEAMLAVAHASFRLGQIGRADSAFAGALPRLPRNVRERFEDIGPVATEKDTMTLHRLPPDAQAEFIRRFWKDLDPDLSTRENEVRLEYWSRVAQAYFLFYSPKRREWDERGEVYVRYGPPSRADYNPVGRSLNFVFGGGSGIPIGVAFPMNVLVWDYPDLGMQVVMQDRILSEYYTLPVSYTSDPDPVPDPEVLGRRTDALATAGGRGVFPTLPPGVERLPIEGVIARFEGDRSPRLLAQVETAGEPADSLWAEWVVLDTSRTEVARGRRALSPSACQAIERRVGDFAAELPPGNYLVGLSVRDAKGRRGVFRGRADLAPVQSALGLSDVVISCGEPLTADRMTGSPVVRIEPNPGARVSASGPLTAYFEIYHLTPDPDGQSRFEYIYTVRSAEKDPRIWIQRLFQPRPQPPPISASRETENPGTLRRQFLTVPIRSLPSGRYRLEIRVRDLIAGNEVVRNAEFVKLGGQGLGN